MVLPAARISIIHVDWLGAIVAILMSVAYAGDTALNNA
jgi:hypothetical protein